MCDYIINKKIFSGNNNDFCQTKKKEINLVEKSTNATRRIDIFWGDTNNLISLLNIPRAVHGLVGKKNA